MSGHRWNEGEEELLGALRSNVIGPTDEQKRRLSARLEQSVSAPRGSGSVVRLQRASRPIRRARFWGIALATLGSPIPLAAAFATGGVTGAVAFATFEHLRSPAPQVENTARPNKPPNPRPHPGPAPSSVPLPVRAFEPVVIPQASAAADRSIALPAPLRGSPPVDDTSPVSSPSPKESLTAQRTLLDTARAALRRGDGSGALLAVEQHEQLYPSSVLCEEREALAVKALVEAGRRTEAEARATRFRARYPNSIMRSAIDDLLGTIP